MSIPHLHVEPLTPESFAPYGWVLGKRSSTPCEEPHFESQELSIWREHLFDAGIVNDTEVLWVSFGDSSDVVSALEARRLTQQVIVPLTGPLILILAAPQATRVPDMDSLRAFEIPIGMGTCIRPWCWHATRTFSGEATALMLSRRSTSFDLIVHLHTGAPLSESTRIPIGPHRLVASRRTNSFANAIDFTSVDDESTPLLRRSGPPSLSS
ncbi:ureidoglycolate lyase [Paraburkholderia sp. Tr-20389]|uniref:ureidoglycolate lyase n=1 Tax=Paraburkholderia sp. Tr-20389 TaxID=2703903 RepID=UPI003216C37A